MGKGLRVHLRLNETDCDLCRWRHSIRCNMLTSYVSQILKAEACGEIAVLPVFDKISADDTPCDVYMLIDDTDIIEFITSIPVYRRNSKIKSIIRKHLHSQMTANGKALFGFAEPSQDRKQITNGRFQSRAFMRSRNRRSMRKSTAKRMKTVRLCLL